MIPILLPMFAVLAPPPVSYTNTIQPIFAKHCYRCHGPTKSKGGLRLDRKVDALTGGDSGKTIVPGKPSESLLLKNVRSMQEGERMPPSGERLSREQIQAIADWIAGGAEWPEEAINKSTHWAFQPVKRPTIPGKSENPIDAFVQQKLTAVGLSPNETADRRTLIRRLKFDLLGLPPTPEEVAEFEKDTSPNAYEKWVDRYLASPQFGERWARHWLDVVRFAESNGFETNQPRPNAWPYRDWVIQSFSEDKPYDRFVFEQLAGDTVGADAATGFLVAGAWDQVKSPDHVLTATQRADELHDMISTTGSTFLGLTVGCARCHAHKFDPVSQIDYYQLKAVFAGVQHGEREWKSPDVANRAVESAALRTRIGELESSLLELEPLADPAATRERRVAVNAKMNIERFKPVPAKFVRMVIFETNASQPCIDELEIYITENPKNVALSGKATSAGDYPRSEIHKLAHLNDGKHGNSRSWISNQDGRGRVTIEFPSVATIDRIVWGRDCEEKFQDRVATRYRFDVSTDGEAWQVVASSDDRVPFGSKTKATPHLNAEQQKKWQELTDKLTAAREKLASLQKSNLVYAGRFTTPEPTFRLHRGDPMAKREAIGPGVLTQVSTNITIPGTASEAERRVALAKWIVDPTNPLTARVMVNRLWQHHFGTGIVDTPSDFGLNGGKPTHPELLDWLAAELMQPSTNAKPWTLKQIHRLIVTSQTYRRSSAITPDSLAKDAQSRLLWRYPSRRLDAEAIRDSILAISSKLDLKAGGPGFDLFQPNTNYVKVYNSKTSFGPPEFRRMVYQTKPRMQLEDTFGVFDCPDAGQIAPRRNRSTTPLQSLNLLNSPFLVEQAKFFAERVTQDDGGKIDRVFRLAFQRNPSANEREAATKLIEQHGLTALCRAVLNANEFLYID